MSLQKTIAVIGATERVGERLLALLAGTQHRLLLFSDPQKSIEFSAQFFPGLAGNPNVEVLTCSREGCWEADIIVIALSCSQLKLELKNIKEVVTQKTVLTVRESDDWQLEKLENPQELKAILPYSKWACLSFSATEQQGIIRCYDEETAQSLRMVLSFPGFKYEVLKNEWSASVV